MQWVQQKLIYKQISYASKLKLFISWKDIYKFICEFLKLTIKTLESDNVGLYDILSYM